MELDLYAVVISIVVKTLLEINLNSKDFESNHSSQFSIN